jgi:hypothetical protein
LVWVSGKQLVCIIWVDPYDVCPCQQSSYPQSNPSMKQPGGKDSLV